MALPSGRMVGSDPWQEPFKICVPAGRYPVHLALAEGVVALVMLRFTEGEPAMWKRAKPGHVSVDSATACLMDHKVARYLGRKAGENEYERFIKRLDDALAENGSYGSMAVTAFPDATVFVFRTWGGDGTFPAYFGYDDRGELARLIIDMLIGPAEAVRV